MVATQSPVYTVRLRQPHPAQEAFVQSTAKRKVARSGRRGAKTTAAATLSIQTFLAGGRVLYAAPTAEQIGRYWFEVKRALEGPLMAQVYYKNETSHFIETPGTEQRLRAKTAWNSDTLRGDYADLLILDEWQLMDEDAWELVGAPMLLDNDGDAVFLYTPPSLRSRSISKARNPRHAAEMYERARRDETGRWAAYHWTSHDNPHLSRTALETITQDMTQLAIRQEILAEDVTEVPGALWLRENIRYIDHRDLPDLERLVVGIDPSGGAGAGHDEVGIIVGGKAGDSAYILADLSGHYSPEEWGRRAVTAFMDYQADRILGESNFGGDMIEAVIQTAARYLNAHVAYDKVTASRGKAVRAEPIAAMYEQGRVYHVRGLENVIGKLDQLEDELTSWLPGDNWSPNRLDALVWVVSDLFPLGGSPGLRFIGG